MLFDLLPVESTSFAKAEMSIRFMHTTREQIFGLASMVDLGKATRHDAHASLRPASAKQVSDQLWTLGLTGKRCEILFTNIKISDLE